MAVAARSEELYRLVAPDARFEQLTAPEFRLTEGPLWDAREGRLLFTDLPRDTIHRLDESGVGVWRRPSGHTNGLTFDREGRLLACESGRRRVTRTEHDGTITVLADACDGRALNAPNDVVASRGGAVWFTDPSTGFRGRLPGHGLVEGVYVIAGDGAEPRLVADDFDLPNGLCLSPDESVLYVDDTIRREIHAFDVLPGGGLANRRVLVSGMGEGRPHPNDAASFGEGPPDGIKVDGEGNLYCTGPLGVWVIRPEGELLGVLELLPPLTHARNLNWGGPDWRTLYVCAGSVTARRAAVFRIELKTRGAACYIPNETRTGTVVPDHLGS
jgi:gluconolactonase